MKPTILLLMLFVLANLSLKSQITLKIVFSNLSSDTGFIIVDFRDGDDHFIKGISQQIINNKCEIIMESLITGKCSFKYFHDKNNNQKLDKYWFGAPKEGYGFSNNAKGKFGPPSFKETVFELKNDTTIVCKPYYINF